MNKRERLDLEKLIDALVTTSIDVDLMGSAERNKYDNLPPGIQESASGEKLDENADRLDEQAQAISDVADELRDLM